MAALGMEPDERFHVHDLLSDAWYAWEGGRNYIELDPRIVPAHVFRIVRASEEEDHHV